MSWFTDKFGRYFGLGTTPLNSGFKSLVGQPQEVWIDTGNSRAVFDSIPQLQTAINRKSSMAANGKWVVVNDKDEEQTDFLAQETLKLLNKPNPMQSGQKWFKQNRKQFYLYRNSFIYKNQISELSLPLTLNNLPADSMTVVLSGKFFKQVDIKDIILRYDMKTSSKPIPFKTEEVLLIADADLDDPLLGSPIVQALKYPLSNIDGAYKSRNILINQRGAFGIISSGSGDDMTGVPFKEDLQKEFDSQYIKQFGNQPGQSRWMLSRANLKFQKISVPVDEMKLFEEVESGYIDILDMLGLNINISPRVKGTTFENLKQGLIMAYNDTIIPEGNEFAQALTSFIGLDKQNRRLKLSYDHLAILQENRKEKSEVLLNVSRAVNQLSSAGLVLPPEQAAIISEGLGMTLD